MKRLSLLPFIVAAAALLAGCATQKSTAAKPLKPNGAGAAMDLSKYDVVSVLTFTNRSGNSEGTSAGEQMASDVAARLRLDFPNLFAKVQLNESAGQSNEVVIAGVITKYRAGDRVARAMLIGLGSASLEGTVVFKEGDTGRELMSANFDKLWAWGGMLGASKGITEMMNETSASIAATAAQGKGWEPPKKH